MLKKVFFVFTLLMIVAINNVWASNQVLELNDIEIGNRRFRRILNNLQEFYRINSEEVSTLNSEKFFEDPKNPSPLAKEALNKIKMNREAYVTWSYRKDYWLLKKHLLRIRNCFKEDKNTDDLDALQTSDLLSYTNGLIYILYALGVR